MNEAEAQLHCGQIHEPCKCDPVGSGEEFCNGGCELREQLAAAQAEIERQRNLLITIDNLCMCMVGTDGAAMVVGNIRLLLEPEVRHAMEGENNDDSCS